MRAGNDEPKLRWRLHRTRNRPLPHQCSTFFGPGRSSSASKHGFGEPRTFEERETAGEYRPASQQADARHCSRHADAVYCHSIPQQNSDY